MLRCYEGGLIRQACFPVCSSTTPSSSAARMPGFALRCAPAGFRNADGIRNQVICLAVCLETERDSSDAGQADPPALSMIRSAVSPTRKGQ